MFLVENKINHKFIGIPLVPRLRLFRSRIRALGESGKNKNDNPPIIAITTGIKRNICNDSLFPIKMKFFFHSI